MNDEFETHLTLADGSWDLRTQVEALEEWLTSGKCDLDPEREWIADIGFCMRDDAYGGGPPLTRNLMQRCLDANLEIWLSEYQGTA
jgi:hypothetical protein